MKAQWDEVERSILLGYYRQRSDHAAADQVRLCSRSDLNWTPSYIRIFDHMYTQFLLAQNSTGYFFFRNATVVLNVLWGSACVCVCVCAHRIAVLRLTCPAETPEKLPMKHGFTLSLTMCILRPCSCGVDSSLHLGMKIKYEVFMAVRMHIMFSGFIWRVIWKVVVRWRRRYSFHLQGRNLSSLQVLLTYDVISGIWLVIFLQLRLWCTSRYSLLLFTEFWEEVSSVTALLIPSFTDWSTCTRITFVSHGVPNDDWFVCD